MAEQRPNAEQERAIQTTEGRVLLIAGPGTGKTQTLVARAVHLIADLQVAPEQITVTTFTRRAAQELVVRIAEELTRRGINTTSSAVHVGNFHHLAGEILEANEARLPFRPGWILMDETEALSFLLRHLSAFQSVEGAEELVPALRWGGIKGARALKRVLDRAREEHQTPGGTAGEWLRRWRLLLIRANRMDYSAMLDEAVRLLESDEEALHQAQRSCVYLMVDEYQDTNPVQEAMTRLLQSASGNLCVVGDDDQGLYRFRGATVQNLLEFASRYEQVQTIRLTRNYRSDGRILEEAERRMREAVEQLNAPTALRLEKHLVPADPKNVHAQSVRHLFAADPERWADRVASSIVMLHEDGVDYADMALLSYSLRGGPMPILLQALRRRGVPLHLTRGGSLMSEPIVRSLVTCLLLAFRPALKTAVDAGRADPHDLPIASFYDRNMSARGAKERQRVADDFMTAIRAGAKISIESLCAAFFAAAPFREVLDAARQGDGAARDRVGSLANFISDLRALAADADRSFIYLDAEHLEAFALTLIRTLLPFLRDAAPPAVREEQERPVPGHLPVMTIHQSKGLEFPVVILVETQPPHYHGGARNAGADRKEGMNRNAGADRKEGIDRKAGADQKEAPVRERELPDQQTMDAMDDARLFYTARTRAKSFLLETGLRSDADDPAIREGDLKGLDLLPGHPADLPPHYAYTTDIARYRHCPRQYFFLREMGLPTSRAPQADYGTLVHMTLARIHQDALKTGEWPELEQAQEILQQVYGGLTTTGAQLDAAAGRRAWKVIEAYLEEQPFGGADQLFAAEEPLLHAEEGRIFEGDADLLLNGGKDLVDFKTGRPRPETAAVYRDQLRFYRGLSKQTRDADSGCEILYYLEEENPEQRLVRVETDETTQQDFLRQIKAVVEKIEAGQFEDRADDPTECRTCIMCSYCGRGTIAAEEEGKGHGGITGEDTHGDL